MPFSSAGFVVFFGRGSTPEPCFVLVRLQMPLARVFLVILCFYRGVDSRILFLLEHTVILYFFSRSPGTDGTSGYLVKSKLVKQAQTAFLV